MAGIPTEELWRQHTTSPAGTLSYRELAEKYGLTYGQVRNRIRRYNDKLEKQGLVIKASPDDFHNRTEFEQTGANTAEAQARGTRVKSLDDLIRECDVDTDVWRVRDNGLEIHTWEGYAKREDTYLEYEGGKATGKIDRGGIETATLYSVLAKFVRIKPIPVYPTIQPVECPVTFNPPEVPSAGDLVRTLFLGDAQIGYRRDFTDATLTPFHDRRVLDLALQIAVADQVDSAYFGGDMLDMSEWTDKFAKGPEFYLTTQPALLEWHWWLRQFRQELPEAEIRWAEGNHEERLRRMLIAHLPAAYDLKDVTMEVPPALSLPNLLALDKLGINWQGGYPDNMEWLSNELAVFHGDVALSTPGATARKLTDKKRCKLIFFHIHRQEMVVQTWNTKDGLFIAYSYSPGCACHIDGRVPGAKSDDNWQQGFCIGEYERGGALVSLIHIPVENGRAVFGGRVFKARDRLADLRQDLPDWQWV